jgi:hypothetical protein
MNQTQAIIVGAAVTFLILAIIGYLTEKNNSKCGACRGGACNCGKCTTCAAARLSRERFALGNTDIPNQAQDTNWDIDGGYTRAFTANASRW